MSIQLIVYPQNYDGVLNPIAGAPTQFINGVSFASGSYSYTSSASFSFPVYTDVISNNPPAQLNAWYTYITNSSGTPYFPNSYSGTQSIRISSALTDTMSGVYQKLSNLTVGATYDFTATISTPASLGTLFIGAFNGSVNISNTTVSASGSTVSFSWTCQTQNVFILIS